MQYKRCFLVCAVLVLLVSCIEKKDTVVSVSAEVEQSALNDPLSAEDIKKLIYENDDYIRPSNSEIVFIMKANFGIPGGDNWIVRLNDRSIFVYVINGNRIEKQYRFFTVDYNLKEHTNFDIMKDIPGTHIPNGTSSIGDFNGDGIDEIFKFSFGGMGNFVSIFFYDLVKDNFYTYCSIQFALIDPDKGPAPAEFMTYQGMHGFKVAYYALIGTGGPYYVLEIIPNNWRWFFYAWDGEQRKYARIGEVIE